MTVVSLGDLISVKHGFAFAGKGFSDDESFPTLVTPGNFRADGGFQEAKPKTYTGEVPDGFVLDEGDLLITMTDLSRHGDTLGMPAVVPGGRIYLHNQRIGRVELIRPDAVWGPYLAYRLRLGDYRSHILGTASGSTVRHTSPSRICEFELELPDLATQTAIAEVLGSLDDKIAANEWVLAANGQLRDALYRQLPKDDKVPLSSLARFVNGKNFTKGAVGKGMPVIRIAELNRGINGSTVFNEVDGHEDNRARPGDILFAWSGSLTVTRWDGPEGLVNQHIFKVIPDGHEPWVVFHALMGKLDDYRAIAADKATTMGHIQRKHLDEEVSIPRAGQAEDASGEIRLLWEQEMTLRSELDQLKGLRDALLPPLVTGQLRVETAKAVSRPASTPRESGPV